MKENLSQYADSGNQTQSGEQGILVEILRRLNIQNGNCVEFGAGDGVSISNTYDLWKNHNWNALLIESSSPEFAKLASLLQKIANEPDTSHSGTIVAIPKKVLHEPSEPPNPLEGMTLNQILLNHGSHFSDGFKEIDLMSIDIDGNDYHVWDSLTVAAPKCIVIEWRSEIPPHIDYKDPPGTYLRIGASGKALCALAEKKGYELVAATENNLFFVRSDLMGQIGDVETDLEKLHNPEWCIYVIGSFSGRRAWITKPHPNHYYTTTDREERRNLPSRQLYPVQISNSNTESISSCFRIKDDSLFVVPDAEKYFESPGDSATAVAFDLRKIMLEAQEKFKQNGVAILQRRASSKEDASGSGE